MDGCRPDPLSARTHSAPSSNVELHRNLGAMLHPRLDPHPRLRDHAEDSLRAEEHAIGAHATPEPGRRRDSHAPLGVIARTLSTMSSMSVHRVAKWPPALVAIQPPSVENSNDWGKWRSVDELLRELGTRAPARSPPPGCARSADPVHLEHAGEGAQIDRHRPVVDPTHAQLHTAHHARAAAVGDRRGAHVPAPAEQGFQLLLALGRGHDLGG